MKIDPCGSEVTAQPQHLAIAQWWHDCDNNNDSNNNNTSYDYDY